MAVLTSVDSPLDQVSAGTAGAILSLYSTASRWFVTACIGRVLVASFPDSVRSQLKMQLRPLYLICDPVFESCKIAVPALRRAAALTGVDLTPILVIVAFQTLSVSSRALGAEVPASEMGPNSKADGRKSRSVRRRSF
ncbi:hypothetical protein FVE85_0454 [Porphyridium purpureum]|uniref:Uncharacterized protein n=1 Tax=Porphyridium purpureum TaxID=35688 RepID=A0A5J4YZY8_PORPP|nr:hypothetical protein FVE85_0454 [Porphyridium purpureum]|eukprot:POR6734..scf208_2